MMLEMEEVLTRGNKLIDHSFEDLTESVVHPASTPVQSKLFSLMKGSQRVLKRLKNHKDRVDWMKGIQEEIDSL